MRPVNRARIFSIAISTALCAGAHHADAVVTFGGTGSNTSAPPGNIANYEGVFDGAFTATPVSPNTILTSAHLNPGSTSTFVFNNGTSVSTTYNVQIVATLDDLAVWEISPGQNETFSLTAPIYTGNAEQGATIVDVGRGYSRGNATIGGWNWGSSQPALSWGESPVSAVPTDTQLGTSGSSGGDFLQFDFDNEDPLSPTFNANEAIVTPGDSGGGAFINVNGQYELAGINSFYGVRVPVAGTDFNYSVTDSSGNAISATLDDTIGYDFLDAGTPVPITSDIPESSFATRISSKQNFIDTADGSLSASDVAAAPINNDGRFIVYSNLTTGAITGGGSLQIGSTSPVKLQIAPNSGTSVIQGFNIMAGSSIDITNNRVIINNAIAGTTEAWLIKCLVSGYNNGAWNGPGIDSSTAAASDGTYGIGMVDANDPYTSGLSSGQVELAYALYGDANLDGVVNGIDFMIMATHFNQATTAGWEAGDFNYSGSVNGADFQLLANNFNQAYFPTADLTVISDFAVANSIPIYVPEPTALLAIPLFCLAARRRRKNRSPSP